MALQKRLIAALIGAVVTIFTTVSCTLHLPGIDGANATPTQTAIPVTILLLENDTEQLPEYLSGPLLQEHPAVSLQEAANMAADAVLISRQLLLAAGEDPAVKEKLRDIVENQKILLVYGASTVDVVQSLDLQAPTMTTQTTYHAVASVAMSNNVIAAGGVLLSKGYTEEHLLQDIREYIPYFRAQIQRVQATADAARATSTPAQQPSP